VESGMRESILETSFFRVYRIGSTSVPDCFRTLIYIFDCRVFTRIWMLLLRCTR
jgi:hypothetical protein